MKNTQNMLSTNKVIKQNSTEKVDEERRMKNGKRKNVIKVTMCSMFNVFYVQCSMFNVDVSCIWLYIKDILCIKDMYFVSCMTLNISYLILQLSILSSDNKMHQQQHLNHNNIVVQTTKFNWTELFYQNIKPNFWKVGFNIVTL